MVRPAQQSQVPALRPVELGERTPVDYAPAIIPTSTELDIIARIGQWAAKSGHFEGISPEGCAMQILAGRDYGIGPWQSLSGMHIIKGKPTLAADTMAALIQRFLRKQRGGEFRVISNSATECTVRYRRPEWDTPSEVTWTIEDAKQAQFLGKADSNWAKYPRAMLRARAISEAAKSGFPDIVAGLYDPDEMDEPGVHVVTLNDLPAVAQVASGAAPDDAPIDVESSAAPSGKREKRRQKILPDGTVVDVGTGEVSAKLFDRTATALKNHANFLGLEGSDLNELAIAELNIPDADAMEEAGGQYLIKLLTYGRHIQNAAVTSRMEKILADMEADPDRERLIDSVWLSERFRAKEAELEAKLTAGQSGGR